MQNSRLAYSSVGTAVSAFTDTVLGLLSAAPFPIHTPSFNNRKVEARTVVAPFIPLVSRPLLSPQGTHSEEL